MTDDAILHPREARHFPVTDSIEVQNQADRSRSRNLMRMPPSSARSWERGDPVTSVLVLGQDRLAEDSLSRNLASVPSLEPLPYDRAAEADVVLILAHELDGQTMSRMALVAKDSANGMRPIILVCHHIGEQQVLRAMDYGLSCVLSWAEFSVDDLVEVILRSRKGHAVVPGQVLATMMQRIRMMRTADSPSTQVSTRELEIISRLADGLGNPEIAKELNFSERTIKYVVSNLVSRFNLQNRTHLVAFAIRNDIV